MPCHNAGKSHAYLKQYAKTAGRCRCFVCKACSNGPKPNQARSKGKNKGNRPKTNQARSKGKQEAYPRQVSVLQQNVGGNGQVRTTQTLYVTAMHNMLPYYAQRIILYITLFQSATLKMQVQRLHPMAAEQATMPWLVTCPSGYRAIDRKPSPVQADQEMSHFEH